MKKISLFGFLFALYVRLKRTRVLDTESKFYRNSPRRSCRFCNRTKAYLGTGYIGPCVNDFWEYDQPTNTWTQKANFPGAVRNAASGFAIGGKGYLGTGSSCGGGSYQNDFYEYDPINNSWTAKANYGGGTMGYGFAFAIGGKGYMVTGTDSNYPVLRNDFWEYDPVNDMWTQKANFAGGPVIYSVAFNIGNFGYAGTGQTGAGNVQFFWRYDPLNNLWTQKANFGGTARWWATGFAIGAKGYIGTGNAGSNLVDFWQYNSLTDIGHRKQILAELHETMLLVFRLEIKDILG